MSVLFLAVPVALGFSLGAVLAFMWSVRKGQLDDLDTPPLRMLAEDAQGVTPSAASVPPRPSSPDDEQALH